MRLKVALGATALLAAFAVSSLADEKAAPDKAETLARVSVPGMT